MRRSDFLKRVGVGVGTALMAPKLLEGLPAREETIRNLPEDPPGFAPMRAHSAVSFPADSLLKGDLQNVTGSMPFALG